VTVAIGARRFRGANWIGMASLMRRQMKSGLADVNYTILGPVISNALYLLVFTTATATLSRIDPDTILAFITPGLICFAIAEKAYEVAGSVLISEKHERTHFDWMMAPLTPIERTLCFIVTSTLCGIFVGLTVWATICRFFGSPIPGRSGVRPGRSVSIGGRCSIPKVDQYSAMHTFVVLPLRFLPAYSTGCPTGRTGALILRLTRSST
jgi:ABC-2 type transport system permease protein